MNQETPFSEQVEDCATDAALFALGALSLEKTKAVELRLQGDCTFCAAQVEHYLSVAEHLSLTVDPVEPPPGLRAKLLARIAAHEALPNETTTHRRVVRGHDGPWIKMPVQGVEMRPLIGEKTFLVRMEPGATFPKHDHPQAEQCYVVAGSITDSDGLTLEAGDFVAMSRGIQHDPIHSATGCTLFIAYAD